VDQPGGGAARGDGVLGEVAEQSALQLGVEDDARAVGADDDVDSAAMLLGADVEPAAAHQGVAGDQDQVEENLQRPFAHRRFVDDPAELDPPVAAEQPLNRHPRLARVDLVAEAAGGAEGQAEEFELVSRGPRALAEQVHAARAHLWIVLVGEQFDAVVERPDGRQQVVAQPRTEQARKFVGFHDVCRPCRAGFAPIGRMGFELQGTTRPGAATACPGARIRPAFESG
jgi:hypothetical protein